MTIMTITPKAGDFEDGCDYMYPGSREPHPASEHRHLKRCGEPVAQVSTIWDSGYGKSSICHRCVDHQTSSVWVGPYPKQLVYRDSDNYPPTREGEE